MLKLTAVAAVLLAAATPAHAADYIANAAEIVKQADWKQMKTVEIVLSEHDFEPNDIRLAANTPYKIVLRNTGEKPHYWTAKEFFKAVATRKAQTREAEFKAPYLDAIEVNNGGVAEFFVVPVTKGTYEVICTIEDHKDKGMTGTITVE